MSISISDVFVEFECPDCNHKEMVSVDSIILSGHPICTQCAFQPEMEYDDEVHIPELGD